MTGRVQCSVGKEEVLIPVGSTDVTKVAGLIGMKVTRRIRMGNESATPILRTVVIWKGNPIHLGIFLPAPMAPQHSHSYVLKSYPLFLRWSHD